MKRVIALLLTVLTISGCANNQSASREEHYQLENGLSIILRPVSKAKSIAIVTIYSIGENHDPAGKSGMGHLIEHLYVTAAAGDTESRDIQTFMSQYPDGWNAQTGKDYTVIATVFPKERIESELNDAAARMSKLTVKNSDVKREIPRIENELANMYGGIPALAAQNVASDLITVHPSNTRKGGLINQIKSIDIKHIQKRIKAFYKPKNATLIIAGAIDPGQIKTAISKAFSEIESGQEISAIPLLPKPSSVMSVEKQVVPRISQAQSHVALAFKTPKPTDKSYPAFLVLVARLQTNSNKLNPSQGVYPVGFALLDRPEVVTISLPVPIEEKPDNVVEKLTGYVSMTTSPKLSRKDVNNTKKVFGYMLGLQDYSDRVLANNIYGVAFTLGMRNHLGIDSQKLLEKINSITPNELAETADEYFASGKYAITIINVK